MPGIERLNLWQAALSPELVWALPLWVGRTGQRHYDTGRQACGRGLHNNPFPLQALQAINLPVTVAVRHLEVVGSERRPTEVQATPIPLEAASAGLVELLLDQAPVQGTSFSVLGG
jgi:hypothetical protein